MDASKVNQLVAMLQEKLPADQLYLFKEEFANLDDDAFASLSLSVNQLKDPTIALLLSIFVAGGRFYIDEIGKGVLMWVLILLCGIGFIWWFIDLFSIMKDTRKYNANKLTQMMELLKK